MWRLPGVKQAAPVDGSHVTGVGVGFCPLVFIWGQRHQEGAKKGPRGYKARGLNLNIRPLKTRAN